MKSSENLKQISDHMIGLGLSALAHANWHANFHSMENAYWPELSVLQAAHAAEILIKSRISQEHPLLIFESLPKAKADENPLSLEQLVESGRTYQFADLPDRLWATTGIKLPNMTIYQSFGKLRNCIQHFAVPNGVEAADRAVEFIYEFIDPFINSCWGYYAVDYNEDYEEYTYLVDGLIRRGTRFLVSQRCAKAIDLDNLEWPAKNKKYKKDMEARFAAAIDGAES